VAQVTEEAAGSSVAQVTEEAAGSSVMTRPLAIDAATCGNSDSYLYCNTKI
jgi:hypothetical protein